MTLDLTLELTPEQEAKLQRQLSESGLSIEEFARRRLLDEPLVARSPTARQLLSMTREERDRYLALAAEDAAPLYDADLALSVRERELTASTALDGEPFQDDA